MSWWIPKQKQYLPETKEWWCDHCGEITPLERNPEWNSSFKGKEKPPDWFVRCAICKEKHWQSSEYECPNCGWDGADEDSMISSAEPVNVRWAQMEFGGNSIEWNETHKCFVCEEEFTFINANF